MKYVMVGEKYLPKYDTAFKNYGYKPIAIPKNSLIDDRIAYHTDLSLFIQGDTAYCSESILSDSYIVNFLTEQGFNVKQCNSKQGPVYPADVNLCALSLGEVLIYNPNTIDSIINQNAFTERISVNQGYCRCSALGFGNNSIITADKGIGSACKAAGISTLIISDKGIELPGFSYGFIGGASIVDNDRKMIFYTGNINLHPDSHLIISFIKAKGFEIISMCDEIAEDIGGGIIF